MLNVSSEHYFKFLTSHIYFHLDDSEQWKLPIFKSRDDGAGIQFRNT